MAVGATGRVLEAVLPAADGLPLWSVLDAIADGQIRPHYQPVVALQAGQLVAVEALARWCVDDEDDGDHVLPATAFVPLLEDAHRVTDLTAFVLDRACADLACWRKDSALWPDFHVAVNISATELVDRRLIGLVRESLDCHGIEPCALCLEVTETAEIADFDMASSVLAELAHDVGVRLAVDDYGTGYATGRYLTSLPFDIVKIDQGFVAGLGQCDRDTQFVRRTIDYAAGHDLRVVAEGIETPGQARALVEIGCDVGQGFGIGMPSPASDVLAPWVRASLAAV
jgi:EAL domain-containing protein (putative c-di-GMP-specific phosphodiesterase class I)